MSDISNNQSLEHIHPGVNMPSMSKAENQHAANTNKLLQYSFIMPLIIQFLSDRDILVRLLLTGKLMKPSLAGYRLKSAVPSYNRHYEHNDRYLPVILTRIQLADIDDLSMHKNVEVVEYGPDFDETITPNSLPDSVKVVQFGRDFRSQIRPGDLPSSLRELQLGRYCSVALVVGSVPNSVESLNLRLYQHKLQPGIIPSSVTSLTARLSMTTISADFMNNLFLPGILPSSLKCLIIGCENSSLENRFPSVVGQMSLENQSDRLCLPPSLIRLVSPCFSHPMQAGDFPESLTELDIVYNSDKPIVLPKSVRKFSVICLKSYFIVPDTVQHLTIRHAYPNCLPIPPGVIPQSVKQLDVRCRITVGSIPNSVQHLAFQDPHGCHVPNGAFPDSLETLLLLGTFDQYIKVGLVPHGVKELVLGGHFSSQIEVGAIPNTVEKLVAIYGSSNSFPPGVIPDSVTWFQLGDLDSRPQVPAYIRQMGFQMDMDSRRTDQNRGNTRLPVLVPGSIPTSVTTLILPTITLLSKDYSGIIPCSVTSLHIFGTVLGLFERIQFDITRATRLRCGVVPSSVMSLSLRHIDIEIEDGFVPESAKDLFVPLRFKVPSHVKANITYEIGASRDNYDDDDDDDADGFFVADEESLDEDEMDWWY